MLNRYRILYSPATSNDVREFVLFSYSRALALRSFRWRDEYAVVLEIQPA